MSTISVPLRSHGSEGTCGLKTPNEAEANKSSMRSSSTLPSREVTLASLGLAFLFPRRSSHFRVFPISNSGFDQLIHHTVT